MTAPADTAPVRRRPRALVVAEDAALVVAFLAVHAVLWRLDQTVPNMPLGDVTITYRAWVTTGIATGTWIGLDTGWVYPIVALLPMVLAAADGVAHVETGWLVLVSLLDLGVLLLLLRRRVLRRAGTGGVRVAWWWLVFLLALGPIALGRIDTVATALALAGVVAVAARPALASAVFTLAAWVKVWPAVLVGVLLLRPRRRVAVVAAAAGVTAVVVLVDLALGGGAHLLSFVGQQAGRGLQIESPSATAFLWRAHAGVPGTAVYYDRRILTFQVSGAGTHVVAALSTPLMALAVVAVVLLALRAVAVGSRRAELAPVVAMALVTALLVTNKVGSPQYVGWLAVPVVWGLLAGRPSARRFLAPAALALVTALATQYVYPAYYDRVLALDPFALTVLTVRNVLEVVMLVWAFAAVVRMARAARRAEGRARGPEGPGTGAVDMGVGRVTDEPVGGTMDA